MRPPLHAGSPLCIPRAVTLQIRSSKLEAQDNSQSWRTPSSALLGKAISILLAATFFLGAGSIHAAKPRAKRKGARAQTAIALTCASFSTVYVDASWVGTTPGDDPDSGGPATSFGCDSFATIQGGIDGVAPGGTVIVASGNYPQAGSIS